MTIAPHRNILIRCINILLFSVSFITGSEDDICRTNLTILDQKNYRYGDIIHISCVINRTITQDLPKLYIIHLKQNKTVPITNSTANEVYANIKVISMETAGAYSCRYGNCTKDSLLSADNVTVCMPIHRHEPLPVKCVVNDLSNMTCEWKSGSQVENSCVMWKAMYKSENMSEYKCCIENNESGTENNCTSKQRRCLIPEADFQRFISYDIIIEEITEYGTYYYNHTQRTDYTIARIDLDPYLLVLAWNWSQGLALVFKLHHLVGNMVCNISYNSQCDDTVDTEGINTSHTLMKHFSPIKLGVTLLLDNLTPYMDYSVNVSCKPEVSLFWSNWVVGSGRTLPAAPRHAPAITGYTVVDINQTHQSLYLYWQPLARCEWYGKKTCYVVTAQTVWQEVPAWNISFDANTVTAAFSMLLLRNTTYDIMVHTENEAGISVNSTQIDIWNPAENEELPVEVVVEEMKNGSNFVLFPNNADNITAVTFFYCYGERKTYPPLCKTILHNRSVTEFVTLFYWDIALNDVNDERYYGVQIERSRSLHSKRIVWSKCVFSANNELPTSLDVSAVMLPNTTSTVMVTLHFDYCQLRHMPAVYQVGIWDSVQNHSDFCKNPNSAYQNFTAVPTLRELAVSASEIQDPRLCLRVLYNNNQSDTSDDFSPSYNALRSMTTDGSIKETSNNTVIIGSVFGSLVGVVVVILSCYLGRRKIKMWYEKNKITISVQQPTPNLTPKMSRTYIPEIQTSSQTDYTIDTNNITQNQSAKMQLGERNGRIFSSGFAEQNNTSSIKNKELDEDQEKIPGDEDFNHLRHENLEGGVVENETSIKDRVTFENSDHQSYNVKLLSAETQKITSESLSDGNYSEIELDHILCKDDIKMVSEKSIETTAKLFYNAVDETLSVVDIQKIGSPRVQQKKVSTLDKNDGIQNVSSSKSTFSNPVDSNLKETIGPLLLETTASKPAGLLCCTVSTYLPHSYSQATVQETILSDTFEDGLKLLDSYVDENGSSDKSSDRLDNMDVNAQSHFILGNDSSVAINPDYHRPCDIPSEFSDESSSPVLPDSLEIYKKGTVNENTSFPLPRILNDSEKTIRNNVSPTAVPKRPMTFQDYVIMDNKPDNVISDISDGSCSSCTPKDTMKKVTSSDRLQAYFKVTVPFSGSSTTNNSSDNELQNTVNNPIFSGAISPDYMVAHDLPSALSDGCLSSDDETAVSPKGSVISYSKATIHRLTSSASTNSTDSVTDIVKEVQNKPILVNNFIHSEHNNYILHGLEYDIDILTENSGSIDLFEEFDSGPSAVEEDENQVISGAVRNNKESSEIPFSRSNESFKGNIGSFVGRSCLATNRVHSFTDEHMQNVLSNLKSVMSLEFDDESGDTGDMNDNSTVAEGMLNDGYVYD